MTAQTLKYSSCVAVLSGTLLSACAPSNESHSATNSNTVFESAKLPKLPEPGSDEAHTIELKLVATKGWEKIGSYPPYTLKMNPGFPTNIKLPEAKLLNPMHGEFEFGPAVQGVRPKVMVIVDSLPDGDERLYVDTNKNGDLSDDRSIEWVRSERKARDGTPYGQFHGGAMVLLGSPQDQHGPAVDVQSFRLDGEARSRFNEDNDLDRFRNYVREGSFTVGANTYHLLLDDLSCSGVFDRGVTLRLDRNKNSKFEDRGERYDASKPFTVDGITFEIATIAPDGGSLTIKQSRAVVPEILPPPVLEPGGKALAFSATRIDGSAIAFPDDFRGKVVLLDFWASWCGPCISEIPNLKQAFSSFHDQGFEIVSISIDTPENRASALEIIEKGDIGASHHVFDTGGWSGDLAQLYCPAGIPAFYLVDGTSGRFIEVGEALRQGGLQKVLERTFKGLQEAK